MTPEAERNPSFCFHFCGTRFPPLSCKIWGLWFVWRLMWIQISQRGWWDGEKLFQPLAACFAWPTLDRSLAPYRLLVFLPQHHVTQPPLWLLLYLSVYVQSACYDRLSPVAGRDQTPEVTPRYDTVCWWKPCRNEGPLRDTSQASSLETNIQSAQSFCVEDMQTCRSAPVPHISAGNSSQGATRPCPSNTLLNVTLWIWYSQQYSTVPVLY